MNRFGQTGWVVLGHLCVAAGIVGLFLPVMPTVIFLIGGAACYARGNPALKRKLLAHPRLGPPLRDWEEHHAVSVQGKLFAIAMIIGGFGASILWFIQATWLRITMGVIGLILIGVMLGLKTRR